ncbi:hypothetical protein MASR1M65_04690 [Saprospiraceae bacterium]
MAALALVAALALAFREWAALARLALLDGFRAQASEGARRRATWRRRGG